VAHPRVEEYGLELDVRVGLAHQVQIDRSKVGLDPFPPVTTVSFPVAQFITRHKPFVADINVPKLDLSHSHLDATLPKFRFEFQADPIRCQCECQLLDLGMHGTMLRPRTLA
jgi:hypothetical protein